MKIKYIKETDIVYISFSSLKIAESDQEKPGIILDYADNGQIVGIEILNASTKMEHEIDMIVQITNRR